MNEYFKTKKSENHCTIANAIYHKFSILYDEVYSKVTAILFARILLLILNGQVSFCLNCRLCHYRSPHRQATTRNEFRNLGKTFVFLKCMINCHFCPTVRE